LQSTLLQFEKRQSKWLWLSGLGRAGEDAVFGTSSNEVDFIDHRPLESVRPKVLNFSVVIADSNANAAF